MKLEATLDLARSGRLYPSLILHGGSGKSRSQAALDLGRCLLCDEEAAAERPCGECRHCRRIVWPERGVDGFHPDFQVLERDMKTATSVEATKAFLRGAQVTPFEAKGQVFVVANAETLSGQAANALLKLLEEPPGKTPRHFFLLCPSQFDLLPTLRSRSLAIYLGSGPRPGGEKVSRTASEFADALASYRKGGHGAELLAAADVLKKIAKWDDPQARAPWERAAAAVVESSDLADEGSRRALLALATDLLEAPGLRLRGIPADRILEGSVNKHLA